MSLCQSAVGNSRAVMTLEILTYMNRQCHVKAVCWEQTEQMGTWGNCLQIWFIVIYAHFEGEVFLCGDVLIIAICAFIQMGEFCWFFLILMSQVGKTS